MIRFTVHAIERYIERVRPGVDRDRAFKELRALAKVGQIRPEAPDWVTAFPHPVLGWLDCGDVCFPLIKADRGSGYAAATCLTRGTIGPEIRAIRKKRRLGRRAYVHGKKEGERGREGRRRKRALAPEGDDV
jgi:hypothetical protein